MPESTRWRCVAGVTMAFMSEGSARAFDKARIVAPLHCAAHRMKRIVVLISGRGSNLEAIVHATRAEGWSARVEAVVSNRPDAAGLAWAQREGIETAVLDHRAYPQRAQFDEALGALVD